MIKGITVQLLVRTESGEDEFGAATYTEEWVDVENVLVAPVNVTDLINLNQLYGKKAVYQLAIPKGDAHIWEDAYVKFFNNTWHIFTPPLEGIEDNIPLSWNAKYSVEHYG